MKLSLHWSIAVRGVLAGAYFWLSLAARAQEPFPPAAAFGALANGQPIPATTPGEAEARLRAIELQNMRLAAELEQLRNQLSPLGQAGLGGGPIDPRMNLEGPVPTPGSAMPGLEAVANEEGSGATLIDLSHGLRFQSADGRYRIELHDLTQVDGRFFNVTGNRPNELHNNIDIPRQRFYFAGQVAEHFDFYSVLNRGYGSLDVLDAYVNFKFTKALNVRVGRTKTPYTYEYYKIAEGDLIAPERSVFVGNLSPNRQVGVMFYGQVLDEQLEYAIGLFNGPHRSFQDFNNFKNPFFYFNSRPFLHGGSDLLRQLNIGASVNIGREDDPLEPNTLRTANDETITPNATIVSPTFLEFNNGVIERGRSAFWSGDIAWFYRSMTALAMYNGGYITYASNRVSGAQVPFQGGSVAVTYFLTGEEIVTRKDVEPLRPYNWRSPLAHPGAIELYSRTSYVNAGNVIFNAGLADPKDWSRNALVFDTGVNWYVNRFVRLFFDWQHAEYGTPIRISSSRSTSSTDMFWLRSQLFY